MSAHRVLIVDDDTDVREVAKVSLQAVAGWEVLTASGGVEGAAVAAAERPEAVLLDVMMPDLDGPSTLARMREEDASRDVPVIFLTAKTQGVEVERLKALGAVAVLAKPFDPMTLYRQVGAALGWTD
jgi:DNA-binding response OmpR family regulator